MTRSPATPALTDAQVDALQWIDRFPVDVSSWLRDGRRAFGPADKWNQMRLSGPRGSIIIPVDDWDVIRHLLEIATHPPSPWKITAAGRAAMQEAEDARLKRAGSA